MLHIILVVTKDVLTEHHVNAQGLSIHDDEVNKKLQCHVASFTAKSPSPGTVQLR